eukprot:46813-Eustigmatos_ZCMA.PRE.1
MYVCSVTDSSGHQPYYKYCSNYCDLAPGDAIALSASLQDFIFGRPNSVPKAVEMGMEGMVQGGK